MRQDIIDLYDDYTHARIGRRQFMVRLAKITGSAVAAASAFSIIRPTNSALAAIVAENDARVTVEKTSLPGKTGPIKGYLAKPVAGGKHGAVVVIHENRGLNAHIEDVARRLAVEGFVAFAPDLLTPAGGTPANSDEAAAMIGKLDNDSTVANIASLVSALEKHADSNGKVGVVGFCWGGQKANQTAVAVPGLKAAVAYYGRQPGEADTAKIQAPLMLHYGALDQNIGSGIPAFEEALKKHNKKYEIYVYEGANHAFNNDTGERYNKEVATKAWERTVAFFKKNLA